MGTDDTLGKVKDPLVAFIRWVKSRSPREKVAMGAALGVLVRIATVCRSSRLSTHALIAGAIDPVEDDRGSRHAVRAG